MKNLCLLASISLLFLMCKPENPTVNNNPTPVAIDTVVTYQTLFTPDSADVSETCYRIPAIITAKNGDLIIAADHRIGSCGDLKWNKNINIVIRRSTDNGTTWSEKETVVDYPFGKSASDASFILDKETGEIFMFFNYMDLDNENGVYYFKYVKSSDNGKTWSEPVDITTQIAKPDWKYNFKFITSGRGTQTKDGKLLHTMVNIQKGLHVFGSDDHGATWYLIDTPVTPADESKIIELENGNWMINSRVSDLGYRYVHLSDNNGQSWESHIDSTLIDPACNASLIRYSSITDGADKNRLLFSNACSSSNRVNLTVKMSEDEGETWAYEKSIYEGSAAYSSMTKLDNGYIGIFFEKDDYTEISFARLSIDAITHNNKQ